MTSSSLGKDFINMSNSYKETKKYRVITSKNSKVGGKVATDQISLGNVTTAEDIQFVYVSEEEGMKDFWHDGVLGLAPS